MKSDGLPFEEVNQRTRVARAGIRRQLTRRGIPRENESLPDWVVDADQYKSNPWESRFTGVLRLKIRIERKIRHQFVSNGMGKFKDTQEIVDLLERLYRENAGRAAELWERERREAALQPVISALEEEFEIEGDIDTWLHATPSGVKFQLTRVGTPEQVREVLLAFKRVGLLVPLVPVDGEVIPTRPDDFPTLFDRLNADED